MTQTEAGATAPSAKGYPHLSSYWFNTRASSIEAMLSRYLHALGAGQ